MTQVELGRVAADRSTVAVSSTVTPCRPSSAGDTRGPISGDSSRPHGIFGVPRQVPSDMPPSDVQAPSELVVLKIHGQRGQFGCARSRGDPGRGSCAAPPFAARASGDANVSARWPAAAGPGTPPSAGTGAGTSPLLRAESARRTSPRKRCVPGPLGQRERRRASASSRSVGGLDRTRLFTAAASARHASVLYQRRLWSTVAAQSMLWR